MDTPHPLSHLVIGTLMYLILALGLPQCHAGPSAREVDQAIDAICLKSGAVASLAVSRHNAGRLIRPILQELRQAINATPFDTPEDRDALLTYWTKLIQDAYAMRRGSLVPEAAMAA